MPETPSRLQGSNMTCLLPDTCIGVSMWEPHPCDWEPGKPGGYYMSEAWCYGPQGRIGYWMRNRA